MGGGSGAPGHGPDDAERVTSLLGRLAERREREPLDPEIVVRLEAACTADDAPLSFRSLARRVHEGRLSWDDYWADPRAHAGDDDLVNAVLRDLTERPPSG